MSREDGGPAFPILQDSAYMGMTLRDYFLAHAPAQEIADLVPADINGCAKYIGIEPVAYKGNEHYILVLAKARGEWADAMLAEREKNG